MHFLPLAYRLLGHAIALLAGLGVLATIDFQDKVTLGSIITTFAILAIAGVFTIRSKIANIWREEAEGERAAKERFQEQLVAEQKSRLEFEKQQQELRHELKNEIAACKSQLAVAEARTDLTAALEAIREIGDHGTAVSRDLVETMEKAGAMSEARDLETHKLLSEIRDKLPNEPIEKADQPIAVHDVAGDEPAS